MVNMRESLSRRRATWRRASASGDAAPGDAPDGPDNGDDAPRDDPTASRHPPAPFGVDSFATYQQPRPSVWARITGAVDAWMSRGEAYFIARNQVASSMVLQMLIYFNIYFSVAFAVVHLTLYSWKSSIWEPPIQSMIVSPLFFFGWLMVEPIRLLLGYAGNLGERVSWLAAFWVLTIAPQMVCHVYFIAGQEFLGWLTLEIELVLHIFFLFLYFIELVVAWHATKRFISKATADFQLHLPEDAADQVLRA